MINYTTIASCLSGLVGYRNSDSSCIGTLNSTLTGSSSGKYVTSVPGVTMEMIKSCLPKDYSSFTRYLDSIYSEESIAAMNDFVKRHKEFTKGRSLLPADPEPVKQRDIYFANTVAQSGRFVGIEICPTQSNISVVLRMIGTQFNTLQSGKTIYLFDSSQNTAIKTFTLTSTKVNSLEWQDLTDFICSYSSTTGSTGGQFLLGYFESSISGLAVDTRLWSGCCGNDWVIRYQRYATIKGVTFANTALNGTNLPTMSQISYTDQTFGLHIKMNITCDISQLICQNKKLFDTLVQLKLARRHLWDFYNANNVNRNADLSREKVMSNITRVEAEYEQELKSIQLDFTQFDEYCMPCAKNEITTQTMR